jgi:RNA polymerase sigma factor (sigma-70 family)
MRDDFRRAGPAGMWHHRPAGGDRPGQRGSTGRVAVDSSPVVPARAQTDGELHRRVGAGDEAALAEVYRRFGPLVHALARRVTGDVEAARDVAQEVFCHFWERPLAYDPDRGSLRTWLATLAHRRAVDWVRREERRRRAPATLAADLLVAGAGPGADEAVEAADTAHRVRRTVAALPPDMREPIELAFYNGCTYREVAIKLGIPEGTAKSRLRSALARLARVLADEGIGGRVAMSPPLSGKGFSGSWRG